MKGIENSTENWPYLGNGERTRVTINH